MKVSSIMTGFTRRAIGCVAPLILCSSYFALLAQRITVDDLFVITVDGRHGYIDRTGKVVIEPRFKSAGNFHDDLALIQPEGTQYKLGYIDRRGKVIIAAQFDAASYFQEGFAAVGFDTKRTRKSCDDCDPNQHWGYVDNTGAMVIRPQYHRAADFSEGLAAVQTDGGKWGFIDKNGRAVVKLQYDYAAKFSEGLACVRSGNKFGYVDRNGRTVIKGQFSDCSDFSEGLAQVRVGGRTVFPGGSRKATDSPGKLRYIDRTGRVVVKLDAESAADFSEGLASFEVKNSDGRLYCGYIDKSGKAAIEPRFDFADCDKFSEGMARILHNGQWGYIDKSGRLLFTTQYALVSEFHNGLAQVQLGGLGTLESPKAKYGYIDRKGSVVWPPTN